MGRSSKRAGKRDRKNKATGDAAANSVTPAAAYTGSCAPKPPILAKLTSTNLHELQVSCSIIAQLVLDDENTTLLLAHHLPSLLVAILPRARSHCLLALRNLTLNPASVSHFSQGDVGVLLGVFGVVVGALLSFSVSSCPEIEIDAFTSKQAIQPEITFNQSPEIEIKIDDDAIHIDEEVFDEIQTLDELEKQLNLVLEIFTHLSSLSLPTDLFETCHSLFARDALKESILGLFNAAQYTPSNEFIQLLILNLSCLNNFKTAESKSNLVLNDPSQAVLSCCVLFNSSTSLMAKSTLYPRILAALSMILASPLHTYASLAHSVGVKIDTAASKLDGSAEAKLLGDVLQLDNTDTKQMQALVGIMESHVLGWELMADVFTFDDDDGWSDDGDMDMDPHDFSNVTFS